MEYKTIISIETEQPIVYSFKRLTYRKFMAALDKLDSARNLADRKERNRLTEEAVCDLIENGEQLLNEAGNSDVQQATVDAIDFNQTGPKEVKKSD